MLPPNIICFHSRAYFDNIHIICQLGSKFNFFVAFYFMQRDSCHIEENQHPIHSQILWLNVVIPDICLCVYWQ